MPINPRKVAPGEVLGPAEGRCNICGEHQKLTEDHTPPASCGGVSKAQIHALYETIGEKITGPKRPKIQRTATLKTLCKRCNSDILGHTYDPALADFCKQVRTIADGVVHVPDAVRVRARPTAVMRSVIGHMAALGIDRYDKGPYTEPIRNFILNPKLPLPESMSFYFWLYPHVQQVRIRDAAYVEFNRVEPFTFWLLKFFPLAFFVTFGTEFVPSKIESLDFYRAVAPDEEHEVRLRVRPLVPELWPEHPTDMAAIMYGSEATVLNKIQRLHTNPKTRSRRR